MKIRKAMKMRVESFTVNAIPNMGLNVQDALDVLSVGTSRTS